MMLLQEVGGEMGIISLDRKALRYCTKNMVEHAYMEMCCLLKTILGIGRHNFWRQQKSSWTYLGKTIDVPWADKHDQWVAFFDDIDYS